MQEDVERDGATAGFRERPKPGDHISRAGEDVPAGAVALEAGARIGPFQLGLIAASDQAEVCIARSPRVFVVCTGDELREPGSPDRPGSIPESNGYITAALARATGADVRIAPRTADDPDATRRIIEEGLRSADVL